MKIHVSKLKGGYVYLELLSPSHHKTIRTLAKDERIWEFNKMLLVDDNYNTMFDDYFNTAIANLIKFNFRIC